MYYTLEDIYFNNCHCESVVIGQKGVHIKVKDVMYVSKILFLSCLSHMKIFVCVFISRRALAREGDYEMMSVCVCVRACVR